MPDRCPECGSIYLRTFRAGTEQVEEEVTRLFPQARVLRMDRDTTTAKDAQLKILSAFASHEADILIGTQMIVKGHDFPDVTLVGILLADLSLNIPDYRAAERTFQLLTQAAGRAGRSSKSGCVLIQTYAPDHYAVQCAARQDYEEFYREEMAFRSMALYPPAGSLVAIHCSCADRQHLETAAQYLRLFLEKILKRTGAAILGPADENVAKINDIWRMVLYLRSGSEELLREARRRLERYIEANEGFSSVEIQFDINQ
jgi:primosomal protein N' (replication factor Y)